VKGRVQIPYLRRTFCVLREQISLHGRGELLKSRLRASAARLRRALLLLGVVVPTSHVVSVVLVPSRVSVRVDRALEPQLESHACRRLKVDARTACVLDLRENQGPQVDHVLNLSLVQGRRWNVVRLPPLQARLRE
jgi:hypothetical protein